MPGPAITKDLTEEQKKALADVQHCAEICKRIAQSPPYLAPILFFALTSFLETPISTSLLLRCMAFISIAMIVPSEATQRFINYRSQLFEQRLRSNHDGNVKSDASAAGIKRVEHR